MAIFYETIPSSLMEWIRQQKLFYVATSPLSGKGHVNLSPKGGEYFGLADEKTFYYQDFSGSGIETISHLLEPGNGRITIMFNAFDGPPKIIRLWGCGMSDRLFVALPTLVLIHFYRESSRKRYPCIL